MENGTNIKQYGKDFKIYFLKGEQKIEYIQKHTNGLNGINLEDVKQIEIDFWNNVYVVLNNKECYKNGMVEDNNVIEMLILENGDLYKIKEDNTIIPVKDKENWNDVDEYLYNENNPYKKIITRGSNIICLTIDNRVVSVCFFELLGIIPENFIDVEDIYMKEHKMYVLKNGEERPLYITGGWEEREYKQ